MMLFRNISGITEEITPSLLAGVVEEILPWLSYHKLVENNRMLVEGFADAIECVCNDIDSARAGASVFGLVFPVNSDARTDFVTLVAKENAGCALRVLNEHKVSEADVEQVIRQLAEMIRDHSSYKGTPKPR